MGRDNGSSPETVVTSTNKVPAKTMSNCLVPVDLDYVVGLGERVEDVITRHREGSGAESSSRVLLVGEVNPHGSDPRHALYHLPRTSSGNRLRCILGLTDLEYHRLLDKANLCEGEWSSKQAAPRLAELVLSRRGVVVLLGARVRAAARRMIKLAYVDPDPGVEFFGRVTLGSGVVLVSLPHPSGLCRLWNEPGTAARARALLREVAPQVPWGRDPEAGEVGR